MAKDLIEIGKKVKSKLPAIIIGIGLPVGLFLATIYLSAKDVSWSIDYESNLIDLKKPTSDLIISFKGKDIQADNLNLKLIRATFENHGASITQGEYDSDIPWGLQIKNAKVIETRLLSASDGYLEENMANPLVISENNVVSLPKKILDRGASFTLEFLLLHNKTEEPQIFPVGKIEDVEEIKITNKVIEANENKFLNLFRDVFYGGIVVQVMRFVLFFFLSVGVFIVFIALVFWVDALKKKWELRNRKLKLKDLSSRKIFEDKPEVKLVFDIYEREGLMGIEGLRLMLSSPEELKKEVDDLKLSLTANAQKEADKDYSYVEKHLFSRYRKHLQTLIDLKIVKPVSLEVDEDFLKLLNKFEESVYPTKNPRRNK